MERTKNPDTLIFRIRLAFLAALLLMLLGPSSLRSAEASSLDFLNIVYGSFSAYQLGGFQPMAQAGVTVTEVGGTNVAEGGATDTYTVKLKTKPSSTVTIRPTHAAGQVTLSTTALTFTTSTWNSAQTITVTAVNDSRDETSPHTGTITHSSTSTDPVYNGIAVSSVSASITDNDTAGMTVTQSGGATAITEGGATDTYTVRLNSQPTATVTVAVAGGSQATPSPASLTFTTLNWATAQTVTLTAVNDSIDEASPHSGTVTNTAASSDPNYSGLVGAAVTPQITDNDTAGVTVTQSSGTTAVTEGGVTDTYTIKLNTQPAANVTVTPSEPSGEVTIAPLSVTFTSANWSTPQTITVTAANDAIDETSPLSAVVTHSSASADPNYGGGLAISSVTASVTDNDVSGVTITQSGGTTAVTEGGATDTYTVKLNSEPAAAVTITPANASSQVTIAPATLTFDSSDWSTPQTVTVTASDDAVDETSPAAASVTHSAASADTKYNGVAITSFSAQVTDNDSAGVILSESGPSTTVTEAGGTDTYTMRLNSQPVANVTITISDAGGQTSPSVSVYTFTAANWSTPQTVTVNSVNDLIDEAATHMSTLSHATASTDPFYNGLLGITLSVAITDNDTAGVTVAQSGGTTAVSEGAATDTYTIRLDTQPVANVTVGVAPVGGQATVSPDSVTFTASDWLTPKTITVTAIDDFIDEASPHAATITHSASSADPNYNGFAVGSVNAQVTDNDTAGVTVTQSGGTTGVTEGATADTYTVELDSQPVADVTLTLTFGSQITVSPTQVTFTASNWSTPRSISVSAVNDQIDEDTEADTIGHAAGSTDPNYNGITVGDVPVQIADNDTAGIVITETGARTTLTEFGQADAYTIRLATQPTANVIVSLDHADGEMTLSANNLTFTAANWNDSQTMTLTPVDDPEAEPNPHDGVVSHSSASGDPKYNGLSLPELTASIWDNDTPGITITESDTFTEVWEAGTGDSYTVRLNTEPTADVTLTLTPDSQALVSPTSVNITPANWTTPQVITVSPVDDKVDEISPHPGTISASSGSTDPYYSGVTIEPLAILVRDDDTAGVTPANLGGIAVVEGGGSDTFTVRLDSQPTAVVTVSPRSLDGQLRFTPASATLDATTWLTPKTFTVSASDDARDEAASHNALIDYEVASTDPKYQAIAVATLSATITDNDTSGIVRVQSGGATAVREGSYTDSFTIRLSSEPAGEVLVSLSVPAGQLARSPASVTFDAANWNVPRTITVTAVNDTADEANPHKVSVGHTFTSTDVNYNGLSVSALLVLIYDDDDKVAPSSPLIFGSGFLSTFSKVAGVSVQWSAKDTDSGIKNYDVRYRKAAYNGIFGMPTAWRNATTSVKLTFTAAPGYSYCFSMRARDKANNVSAWSAEKCTSLLLNNTSLTAKGTWSKKTGTGFYRNSYSLTRSKGATLTAKNVKGRRVAVFASTCKGCGKVAVYWGATLVKTIDLNSSTNKKTQLFYTPRLGYVKTGNLTIKVLTSKKPILIEGAGVAAF